jgi:hypothetical protein
MQRGQLMLDRYNLAFWTLVMVIGAVLNALFTNLMLAAID